MYNALLNFFISGPYIPHGHCYLWQPNLVWLHVVSDAIIALAYYSIPLTLFYFVRKRQDLPFDWIFLLFAGFIVACGTTHVMEIWTLWHPTYWLSGGIKAATATVSLFTALELMPLVPQALALPSPAQLRLANEALEAQVQERLRVEEELRKTQNQLEQRVQERTAELLKTNEQLQQEIRERQQTEEALRLGAERLSLALSAAKMGDWNWDAGSDIVTFSERAAEFFGIPPGPYMTWTEMRDLLHEDDREHARLEVERAILEHSDYNIEYRVVPSEGKVCWIAAKGRAQYAPSGEVLGMIGVVQDITEQKKAEQEREHLLAREQAARVEAETARELVTKILESITDGFIAFDRNWHFTYINHEGSRILDRSSEDLLGKSVWQEFPELAETSFGRLCRRAVAEGVPLEQEDYYSPFNAWLAARVYPSESGLALYLLNISERKEAEAKIANLNRDLQNRVDELQTLFEVIPIGILIANDPEFKQVRANAAFAHILGISDNASLTPPEDTLRPTYKIFRNGQELSPEETPLRYAGIHGVNVAGVEVDVLRGDGVLFNLYGYASPLFNEAGKTRGVVGAFLDITERKRAEAEREQLLKREKIAREQAEAANRVKDEFLAVLSHELRTPLNPILGWVKLLRLGRMDEQKTALALETIERNVRVQIQLIEDLLDISKILQGKLTLNVRPVDLAVTVEAAKETMRLAADAKALQIRTELEPVTKMVMGDSNRLQQVVWNLLSNAVKFTPANGQILVRLEYSDNSAQITVSDTGKGISRDFLPHVFEYFRQADSSTTRKFGGLGLGLAIARQIVELHGGMIEVESPGEGLGTTFTVRLPLMTTALPVARVDQPITCSSNLSGIRVLVVDDEADSREIATFVLEQCGAVVTAVASAEEAYAALNQLKPDILVSDIGMPDVDGYSLMQRIRTMDSELGKNIPAIALTAYAGEMDYQQSREAGFQQHVPKPVDPDKLVEVAASLVLRN